MPFDNTFGDIYEFGIRLPLEESGILGQRVDEQVFHRESIVERIYSQIEVADVIIADMTGKNPNVFYEVGYAHAREKLCLLLTSNASDIPFDLKHHRHIVYDSVADLKKKLNIDLVHVREEIDRRSRPIVVELEKVTGDIVKNSYSAAAVLDIYIDLQNRSNSHSEPIEAIYYYTGGGWLFKQDGQDCPRTVSNLTDLDYVYRHLLKSPVNRLMKNGWAQLKITGSKTLAYTRDGELKDSYRVVGRSLIKVVAQSQSYDYNINVDINTDDIPF